MRSLSAASAEIPCPVTAVDPVVWRTVQSYALGLELQHPPQYFRKFWDSRSDSLSAYMELWRDPRGLTRIHLIEVRDTMLHRPVPDSVPRCVLRTRSGQLRVVLSTGERFFGGGTRAPVYQIWARIPAASGVLSTFYGSATDSSLRLEQLAILASVRYLRAGAPPDRATKPEMSK